MQCDRTVVSQKAPILFHLYAVTTCPLRLHVLVFFNEWFYRFQLYLEEDLVKGRNVGNKDLV